MIRYGEKCLKIETDDITSLPANICEMLETGEAVVVVDGNEKKTYMVTHKELNEGLRLTYCDNSKVETIYYKRTEGVWGYDKTETSKLGSGGLNYYKVKLWYNSTFTFIYSTDAELDITDKTTAKHSLWQDLIRRGYSAKSCIYPAQMPPSAVELSAGCFINFILGFYAINNENEDIHVARYPIQVNHTTDAQVQHKWTCSENPDVPYTLSSITKIN